MEPINFLLFKDFAKTIGGTELLTKKRFKKFLFEVDSKGFYYLPYSTRKQRFQGFTHINRFLIRFNKIKSISPKDYQEISANASYLLAIIQAYLCVRDKGKSEN